MEEREKTSPPTLASACKPPATSGGTGRAPRIDFRFDKRSGGGLQILMHKSILSALGLSLAVLLLNGCCTHFRSRAALACFQNFPTNASPRAVGEEIAQNFLARKHATNRSGYIIYPEVCTAYGGLRFADTIGDAVLKERLVRRYDDVFPTAGNVLIPSANNVDSHVFGVVPLEIYLVHGGQQYLALGLSIANKQWANPTNGLTRETRYWIDDMFMISALQIQAYRATRDPKYADRAANEMAAYLDKLQKPNGLFFHGPEIPFYWGRGNGWFAVGMAEVLSSLPPEHPQYARIMAGYKKMMAGLKTYQAPSGLWRQLIDDDQSWEETSCTGMFTCAMIMGVKHGWLEAAEYGGCARRGWIGLCGYVNDDGNVREICVGTNLRWATCTGRHRCCGARGRCWRSDFP
jgi:rhamnogalacturonyl hydrolase YesR